QVRAGRRDPIALGIENRYPITVVALVVKRKLVSVITMCAGCHRGAQEKPQGRCRHEFPSSSVLRAEHQAGIGEDTTFSERKLGCVKVISGQAISSGHVRFAPSSGHQLLVPVALE